MKNRFDSYFSLFLLAIFFFMLQGCTKDSFETESLDDWENLAVLEQNKEPARCTAIPYPDVRAALENDPSLSPFYVSLNGTWKFHYADKPADRPVDFYKDDYDMSQWHDITVPGNWELQGFGVPIYTDEDYPFPCDPPRIPHNDNPVGSFKRSFTVPANWENRQVFLHFGSVKSALYVWVNGNKVGYSQGSKTPAEFNITPFLRQGENSLALEVYRYSDGAYLEDQDYWKISGLERDVYLFSTPPVHIRDFFVLPDLDEDYCDATLNVTVQVQNHLAQKVANHHVRIDLLDEKNNSVWNSPVEKKFAVEAQKNDAVVFDLAIQEPKKWSAETPHLYTLLLSLIDESNRTASGKRHPDSHQGGQPSRTRPVHRAVCPERYDDQRYPDDENVQHQCRANEPLSQHTALV
jgi:beta-galactosidase